MNKFRFLYYSLYLLFIQFYNGILGYRPVVVLHGLMAGTKNMNELNERIQQIHPGTEILNIPLYPGFKSLDPMWNQVDDIGSYVMKFSANYTDGFHLVGFSQGGLIARAILQRFPYHNVRNFISLSSPQAGVWGIELLTSYFPDLVRNSAYEFFYSDIGQDVSFGNYWNDPLQQKLYFEYCNFLPYVNNEIFSSNSSNYIIGLTRLNRMVLIGGPDDEIITPWQSSSFGYYDIDQSETVAEMKDRKIYKTDAIGLQTLDRAKKLFTYAIPGVSHTMWHRNISVIDSYVLPYLD